jgi:hypothetical protein
VAQTRFRPDIKIPVTIYRQHRDISESRHSGQFTKSHYSAIPRDTVKLPPHAVSNNQTSIL